MSKELVISASSHERRVAILEEGQLVEIYIEREKEFALVGSIYKGRVTRVLPGMQSAFVDIGLDGDAFLYVSDVFENLEDYDHGHEHAPGPVPTLGLPASPAAVELLPGETLSHASVHHEDVQPGEFHRDSAGPAHDDVRDDEHHDDSHASPRLDGESPAGPVRDEEGQQPSHRYDERQPESNASAPQNFAPHYNPTQNYPSRSDRPDRGGDYNRGNDRGGDRGGDRGRGGRWPRRGGRRRSGPPPSSGPGGGRNLPPSKYASPQGGDRDQRGNDSRGPDTRGYDNRGPRRGSFDRRPDNRGFDNRRPDDSRRPAAPVGPPPAEDEIVLPGESLAKYRARPAAAPPQPVIERTPDEIRLPLDEEPSTQPRGPIPAGTPASGPRRFSGGLPRWLLADAGSEAETPAHEAEELTGRAPSAAEEREHRESPVAEVRQVEAETETTSRDPELSDDQVAALGAAFVEAKHEEAQDRVETDVQVGAAEFEPEEDDDAEAPEADHFVHANDAEESEHEEETEEESEEGEESVEIHAAEESQHDEHPHDEENETEHRSPTEQLAEDEADAAHDEAHQIAAQGEHAEHHETEAIAAAAYSGAPAPQGEEDAILLPGETRSPRTGPREDFPRDSARIGGNPRSRFQRPFRSGGRDRNDRGGPRGDSRGSRDSRAGSGSGRPDRGPDRGPDNRRGGGGRRFDRRGPGGGGGHHRSHQHGSHSGPRRPQLISEMLKAGQEVVVQIAKEPLGKKGARITSHVALPGRFLVYMPTIDHIGVSRKIASAENRSRLRRLVGEARGSYPGGFIVRTAAGGATDEEIRTDIEFLGRTWNEIKQKNDERKPPALLHRDLNLVERILRDYVSDDFNAIWIDNEEEYGKVVEFVSRFQPKLASRVKLYTKDTPIFEEFGIQHELDKALRAKVWLKSGGYIVINHTEALVAIDVNTGKFVGKGSTRLEDTIVKTNLEAVKEIVRQIRLRDLGGIIVVDFIDMEERRNREKVLSALQQALDQDKAPSKALSFNEFGLVCITRKRTKQALERVLCQPCPSCTGSGMVKSIPTLCYEIQSEARKMATADHDNPNLTLRVHPEIAKALKTRESMLIDELEQNAHKHIIIQSDPTLHWEQYDIY
jgi:Rne/Rng family ribonuclease